MTVTICVWAWLPFGSLEDSRPFAPLHRPHQYLSVTTYDNRYNLQQTYITTAIKVARKWAAPRDNVRDACHQGRVQSASGWYHSVGWYHWFDWTARCDWLQVASSRTILYTHNTMPMRAARLVQVLQDLLQVLSQLWRGFNSPRIERSYCNVEAERTQCTSVRPPSPDLTLQTTPIHTTPAGILSVNKHINQHTSKLETHLKHISL